MHCLTYDISLGNYYGKRPVRFEKVAGCVCQCAVFRLSEVSKTGSKVVIHTREVRGWT